jgi:hypothetical protein
MTFVGDPDEVADRIIAAVEGGFDRHKGHAGVDEDHARVYRGGLAWPPPYRVRSGNGCPAAAVDPLDMARDATPGTAPAPTRDPDLRTMVRAGIRRERTAPRQGRPGLLSARQVLRRPRLLGLLMRPRAAPAHALGDCRREHSAGRASRGPRGHVILRGESLSLPSDLRAPHRMHTLRAQPGHTWYETLSASVGLIPPRPNWSRRAASARTARAEGHTGSHNDSEICGRSIAVQIRK